MTAQGRVTIDGVDVRQIDETALRQQIGVALQESVLFSGTIRDNIRYGRPDADEEAVIVAAKMAQAHDFIVGFPDGYDPDLPVLKDVDLHAKPGQFIALVGPTGAGKATIVNLLTRFYAVDQGDILIDGHDMRQVKQDDRRRQLGIVLQDTYLFAETMMENIRYGRLDASGEEVFAAGHGGAFNNCRAGRDAYHRRSRHCRCIDYLGPRVVI